MTLSIFANTCLTYLTILGRVTLCMHMAKEINCLCTHPLAKIKPGLFAHGVPNEQTTKACAAKNNHFDSSMIAIQDQLRFAKSSANLQP